MGVLPSLTSSQQSRPSLKDTSFSDLANNEKLEMAKELLLTSDMTVVQIAETLNYSNVQNFIRFFSKKVGMTPGKYHKDYQNKKK